MCGGEKKEGKKREKEIGIIKKTSKGIRGKKKE